MKRKRKGVGRRAPITRVREVGFQSIEAESQARLTLFEKGVLNSLHSPKDSPRESLISKEETLEAKKEAIQTLRRLRRYVKYARLTQKQQDAYKLFFLTERKNVTHRKLARKLKISLSSAWARIHGALMSLEKVKERRMQGEKIKKILDGVLYAGKLKKVLHLYFEKGWPPKAIAKSLHSNLSTIYDNIRMIRLLGCMYASKERISWKQARKIITADISRKNLEQKA